MDLRTYFGKFLLQVFLTAQNHLSLNFHKNET